MEIFKDYVYLGRTATDYINLEALKKTVQRNTKERIDFATGHTWENNVQRNL
jgi:hypothetical protein